MDLGALMTLATLPSVTLQCHVVCHVSIIMASCEVARDSMSPHIQKYGLQARGQLIICS